mmetsp:Transcript_16693/g.34383  ORF Transcript_16693/g.34383 Transcript_16693/m.34383 type:complete len:407 (-) Transcript_16693:99-1319(-)
MGRNRTRLGKKFYDSHVEHQREVLLYRKTGVVRRRSGNTRLISFLACLFFSARNPFTGSTLAFKPLRLQMRAGSRRIHPFIIGSVTTLTTCSISATTTPTYLFATSTQYTIDDSVCLPTKTETLEKAVHKACRSLDVYMEKKPTAAHTRRAFEVLVEMIGEGGSMDYDGIVLDSGCGTGKSTKILADSIHPRHLVIGVDRSLARLTKTKDNRQDSNDRDNKDENKDGNVSLSEREAYCHQVSENAYLVRAELVDFWRCCIEHGWTGDKNDTREKVYIGDDLKITHHYMLYPNPYPTKARLSSRWYAHPSFPLILKLGIPNMVIRSNWEGYLKEFARAIDMANDFYANQNNEDDISDTKNLALPYVSSAKKGPTERMDKSVGLTNFESKYDNVGESTYELLLAVIDR